MAHTLNEQVVSFPAGGGNTVQQIVDAIATLTGWEKDEENTRTLYVTEDHTIKLVFDASVHFKHTLYDHGIAVHSNNGYNNPTGAFSIRFHRSKGETVQYLNWYYSSSAYIIYVFAKNEDNKVVTFIGSSGNNASSVYTDGIGSKKSITLYYGPGVINGVSYSLAKMPDFLNNKEFPELFYMWSVGSPTVDNNLVSFGTDRNIYRTVTVSIGIADSNKLAFPVADE